MKTVKILKTLLCHILIYLLGTQSFANEITVLQNSALYLHNSAILSSSQIGRDDWAKKTVQKKALLATTGRLVRICQAVVDIQGTAENVVNFTC